MNYDGTVTKQLSTNIAANGSFGMQFLSDVYKRTDAIGTDLGSVGVKSIVGGGGQDEQPAGYGAEVRRLLRARAGRLARPAVRHRRGAHGQQLGVRVGLNRVFYPKLSASYVISEEPFFKIAGVNQLRLRAAWGQAGNAPGPFDAIRSYTSSVVTYPHGNLVGAALRDRRQSESQARARNRVELGFEASLLDDLFGVDMTYYNKKTKDALMQVAIAPSTGFVGNQLVNLGTIANSGFEMIFNTAPIRRPSLTVEATVTLSTNKNRLVSFGDNRAPIIFGSYAPSQRYQVGYPLGAFWAQQVQRNADGTIVKVAGRPVLDTASVYMGPSVPTREMAFTPSVRLFDRLRLRTLFDYKSGHYQFNVKDWRRDRALVSWETVDPAANADEVLVRSFASQTFLHIQKADFLKLRDVSASYDLPVARAKRFVDRATVTRRRPQSQGLDEIRRRRSEVNFDGVFDVQPQ